MLDSTNKVGAVIGASHAGINFAFNLRKEGWQGKIILFDADPEFPYHRPPLSKAYLNSDKGTEHSLLFPKESYESNAVTLKLGVKVNSINREQKSITINDGTEQVYDKLVIATGARPFIPPIKGIKQVTNLYPMRTAEDAVHIRNAFNNSDKKRVVVIGGGYIGLETAASLKKLGAKVVVLEREERVLARVTAPVVSEFFTEFHKKNGVQILTSKNVNAIEKTENYNLALCDDASSFKADVIVVGVGIRVNTELAQEADLTIESGIKVDATAKTNDDNIYSVGDCTYHYNPHYKTNVRLESVQNAVDQSKVAAKSICGQDVVYDTIPWFWSDQFDIKLQMVGLSNGYNEVIVRQENTDKTSFSVWYFKDDELLSVDAINNARAYMLGTRLIKGKQKINKTKLVDTSIPIKPTSFLD
mgnify:CR=1 FL=1